MCTDLAGARVRDWMLSSPPVVAPRTTVATALRLLREHDLSALPVCEGGRIQGLVNERALLRLTPSEATTLDVYELHDVLDRLTIGPVIETPVPAVAPDSPLLEAASLLVRTGRMVVLVQDGARLAGLLTAAALLAAAIGQPAHAAAR